MNKNDKTCFLCLTFETDFTVNVRNICDILRKQLLCRLLFNDIFILNLFNFNNLFENNFVFRKFP